LGGAGAHWPCSAASMCLRWDTEGGSGTSCGWNTRPARAASERQRACLWKADAAGHTRVEAVTQRVALEVLDARRVDIRVAAHLVMEHRAPVRRAEHASELPILPVLRAERGVQSAPINVGCCTSHARGRAHLNSAPQRLTLLLELLHALLNLGIGQALTLLRAAPRRTSAALREAMHPARSVRRSAGPAYLDERLDLERDGERGAELGQAHHGHLVLDLTNDGRSLPHGDALWLHCARPARTCMPNAQTAHASPRCAAPHRGPRRSGRPCRGRCASRSVA
jgi:hypothetical protein